jgi:stage IV sporulation protein B
MKIIFRRIASAVLCVYLLTTAALAKELVPVGKVIGLELQDRKVVVVGFDEKQGQGAKAAGLLSGDVIQKIDDVSITCAEDVRRALQKSDGTVSVEISRGGKTSCLQMSPVVTENGPKLGVYLRQGISGIGTVTFYDPETGLFGTLGHGVSDAAGSLLKMTGGNAYEASVISVKKGKSGDPGQLKGSAEGAGAYGELLRNTPQGVFGITHYGWQGDAVPTASYAEIIPGPVQIRCQIDGGQTREYSAEILKIYPETRTDGRNFLLKVTDPRLLEATGGIVQGMSGSPIIQDGKLVGAVTHVLVNDPTRGYGIFIENMLEAAE